MTPPQASADVTERLVWIDWLKVIVVFGVFVYHAAEPFLVIEWIVSNDERSTVLSALAGFLFLFGMPLMFLLTGATAWLSLGRRSLSAYGIDRVRRLLIPLVAGILILTPLQWWLAAAIDRGGENPLNTIAWFFGGMRFEPTMRWFGDYGMHLWFIAFLLAYSILCLPLLGALRRPAGARLLSGLAALSTPVLLLILFVPILASQYLLRIPAPAYRDWADFALWLGFFAVGVALVADQRLLNAVVRSGPRLIGIGVALVGCGVAAVGIALANGLIPAAEAGNLRGLETAPALDVPSLGVHHPANGRRCRPRGRVPVDGCALVPLAAVVAAPREPGDPALLRAAPPGRGGGGGRGGPVVDGPVGQARRRPGRFPGRHPGAHRADDANPPGPSAVRHSG